MRDLQALCFDLDDTLWDVRSVLRRAEEAVAEFLAANYPALAAVHSTQTGTAARMALAGAEPARAHDLTWLRTEAMKRMAATVGLPARVGEEAFEVFIAARNEVTLYDDVTPALAALQPRYRLATLSNGNADLARIGLAPRFQVMLNARDVGAAKPDPRAFTAVAEALRLPPSQIAYVGDDPHADVFGARGAGMRTIWINRQARFWPADVPAADREIRDLSALLDELE